tara:strand:+ start:2746 stop:3972 length:1227 start_codon:yes stop_codon:yes gene_type:complete
MKLKRYNSIGKEELNSAVKVLKSGILSDFIGAKGRNFNGGKYVQKFEKQIQSYFNVKYAISVNSWTSGLICAIGAINPSPGDEIICTPWTMCACATAILHWNCIPVFADINKTTFNYDLNDLEKKINKKTIAIIAVDIFGQSENIEEIQKLTKKRKIKIISDTAQAIGSTFNGKYSGTLTDIGGFSFNYHKHINTGEGGMIVTNSKILAKRCKLIRNHGEAAIDHNNNNKEFLSNILGYNFRLGEIEAAIGIEQIKKLKTIISYRKNLAQKLIKGISDLKGLQIPVIKKNCSHVYYVVPFVLDLKKFKYSRKQIVNFLRKEKIIGLNSGYANLHLLPMFRNKIAYGKKGFPWSMFNKSIKYEKGLCKNAEELHDKNFFYLAICAYDYKISDMKKYIHKFRKVWKKIIK